MPLNDALLAKIELAEPVVTEGAVPIACEPPAVGVPEHEGVGIDENVRLPQAKAETAIVRLYVAPEATSAVILK